MATSVTTVKALTVDTAIRTSLHRCRRRQSSRENETRRVGGAEEGRSWLRNDRPGEVALGDCREEAQVHRRQEGEPGERHEQRPRTRQDAVGRLRPLPDLLIPALLGGVRNAE